MAALLRRGRRLLRIAPPGSRAPWSELPPDLLLLVLSRLPSHADRVRLRAVCRPWCSAARLQPQPSPFAWLFVRADTFLALPEGALHRMPLDQSEILLRVPDATGNMFFLVHRDGSCYLMMNPPSGRSPSAHQQQQPQDRYQLPQLQLDQEGGGVRPHRRRSLQWHGSYLPELHRLEIDDEHNRFRSVRCIRGMPRNGPGLPALSPTSTPRLNGVSPTCWRSVSYLVACGDRLLMVERHTLVEHLMVHTESATRERSSRPIRTQLEVWEGADLNDGHGHWREVDTLMGHALFISRGCSRSLPAAQCGAREDCVYFVMAERPRFLPGRKREPQEDVLHCVVYNVRHRVIHTLETSEATASPWEPTWFSPPMLD
ncbi:hypothetical protein ZWY2020_032187 [Hordeum vulgare]|nr:hypothetical protein ZWY2020_032187 [Hordeum vulgare]